MLTKINIVNNNNKNNVDNELTLLIITIRIMLTDRLTLLIITIRIMLTKN